MNIESGKEYFIRTSNEKEWKEVHRLLKEKGIEWEDKKDRNYWVAYNGECCINFNSKFIEGYCEYDYYNCRSHYIEFFVGELINIIEKEISGVKIYINEDVLTLIDNEDDCIEITKQQLKDIYDEVFK